MAFKIKFDRKAYKELKKLNDKIAREILTSLYKLTSIPEQIGKILAGKLKGKRRLRVGDYRIIFWIEGKEKTVWIIAVGHRKEIY